MQLCPGFRRVFAKPVVLKPFPYGVATIPDLDGVAAKSCQAVGNDIMRHPLVHQHLSDTMAAVPFALKLFHVCTGEAFVVQATKSQTPLEGPLDLIPGKSSINKLAGQFGTTVVPSRQQPQSHGVTVPGSSLILHGGA